MNTMLKTNDKTTADRLGRLTGCVSGRLTGSDSGSSAKTPRADFLTWLTRYRGEDTPLGDLADDMRRDVAFRRGAPHAASFEALLGYLGNRGACDACLEAAKRAWKKWERGQR